MDTHHFAVRCPKCGKKTSHHRKYKDGSSLYIHKQKQVLGPFPYMRITDACATRKEVGK